MNDPISSQNIETELPEQWNDKEIQQHSPIDSTHNSKRLSKRLSDLRGNPRTHPINLRCEVIVDESNCNVCLAKNLSNSLHNKQVAPTKKVINGVNIPGVSSKGERNLHKKNSCIGISTPKRNRWKDTECGLSFRFEFI